MKRVGILSMQRIFNYGSFLQAYGLRQIILDLGYEVQFVDYHPGETLIPSNGGTGIKRKIKKGLEAFRYEAPMAEKLKFINYKKNYAANYYPYLGITNEMNYSPDIDVLVIGSDEVFNCVQDNTNVGFCPELFGQGAKAKKVISYAASFGNTTIDKLEKYDVADQVSGWLKEFDAVSVRDENSAAIIEKLTGKNPDLNLDPVLMYAFIEKCEAIPKTINESKYMILYGYSGRFTSAECRKIREFADKKHLKVFCIGGVQNCCDRFLDCNPFEVIAYFQHAEYVVTDTFHGTILSVITHAQFTSVVRNEGYGNAEKLTDLLQRLDLTGRSLDEMNDLEMQLTEPIDYAITDKLIQDERIHTEMYLRKHLG
ncbi:MAG: polysaccharide pyruvyl transferase family protein [Lachnospiraceae bacterium]|nr:polysaccharide pyruvyl transferase family protein [Lachnospiraceae bacterium]